MTFEKWWQENSSAIYQQGGIASPAVIKSLFKEAWHDGYKVGYKPIRQPTTGKIQYYYGCPHCYEDIDEKLKRKDVAEKRDIFFRG